MKPSGFANSGFPNCSTFGETWHEITAVAVLQAMVLAGDEWKEMTSMEVMKIYNDNRDQKWTTGAGSALKNNKRLERVCAVLTNEEQARDFSPFWGR